MQGVERIIGAACLPLYPDFLTDQVGKSLTRHKHEAELEDATGARRLWLEIVQITRKGESAKVFFQTYEAKRSQYVFVLLTQAGTGPWLFMGAHVVSKSAYDKHDKETLHAYLLSA